MQLVEWRAIRSQCLEACQRHRQQAVVADVEDDADSAARGVVDLDAARAGGRLGDAVDALASLADDIETASGGNGVEDEQARLEDHSCGYESGHDADDQ